MHMTATSGATSQIIMGLEKLLRGILRYRLTFKKDMVRKFEDIRDNPTPTALIYTCMDSRMLPSRFCQADVGDMFIVRNAGNLIPHSSNTCYESVTTEPGALELACVINDIRNVIVIGHSDCKAMNLLHSIKTDMNVHDGTNLEMWMKRHAGESMNKFEKMESQGLERPLTFGETGDAMTFEAYIDPEDRFEIKDKLSQVNCLQQLQNIASHSFLTERLLSGQVRLHAMFFDIYSGEVYMFSRKWKKFIIVDEETVEKVFLQDANVLE